MTADTIAAVTVVVPTLGRPPLEACLRSIHDCRPAPAEIIVVAQGDVDAGTAIAAAVSREIVALPNAGSGVASGTNHGVAAASHDVVVVTHDDCTVARDWVGTAAALARAHPDTIITGRVLPAGDPDLTPSWKSDADPHDFTGTVDPGALFPNNMVLPRQSFLAFGGFDERFGPAEAAEDGDLAYRWLAAGRSMRYEPALVVEHHDWRPVDELERLYVRYARGTGALYGKHLRAGDARVLRFLLRDLRTGVRAQVERRRGRIGPSDWRLGLLRGLPGGLIVGLRWAPNSDAHVTGAGAVQPAAGAARADGRRARP